MKVFSRELRRRASEWDVRETVTLIGIFVVLTVPAIAVQEVLDLATAYKRGSIGNVLGGACTGAATAAALLLAIRHSRARAAAVKQEPTEAPSQA